MRGLIFGAGNIGRGFLGLLLSQAGIEVTFIEVDDTKVSAINSRREYPVFVVGNDGHRVEYARQVRAVAARDTNAVAHEVSRADIILTAVGKDALRFVAPSLARGLLARAQDGTRSDVHVVVVACENVQDNTSFLRDLVSRELPDDVRERVLRSMSFPNCVVDRIVPNTLPEKCDDPIAVAVEEYFQLAIDGDALVETFPAIPGVEISKDLSATLEQKLCTLNMAHAIVGYYGYLRGHTMIHHAVDDPLIRSLVYGALEEVGSMLVQRHRSIAPVEQATYADKVLSRFQNPYLRDEITRVARQPRRKLGSDDRLVRPLLLTWEQGRIPAFLASGITAALHFDFGGDSQALSLVHDVRARGIEVVLHEVSGLAPDSELGRLVKSDFLLRSL